MAGQGYKNEPTWEESAAMIEQYNAKMRNILADSTIIVPSDLSPEAVKNDTSLTKQDWEYAEMARYRVQDHMKLKMMRIIFFRGTDQDHSFTLKHWQTRCTILTIRFHYDPYMVSPSGRAYLAAVKEATYSPSTFTAREHFVAEYHRTAQFNPSSTQYRYELPKWNKGTKKRFDYLVKWATKMCDYYKQNPQVAAAEALKLLGEPVTPQAEMDEMDGMFEKMAERVKKEATEMSLEKRMEVLQVVNGKGMEQAFGLPETSDASDIVTTAKTALGMMSHK